MGFGLCIPPQSFLSYSYPVRGIAQAQFGVHLGTGVGVDVGLHMGFGLCIPPQSFLSYSYPVRGIAQAQFGVHLGTGVGVDV
jgi:hypothetical protein